jgi:di/tricarboxylate transporter
MLFFSMSLIPEALQPYFVLLLVFLLFLILYRELIRPSLGFLLVVLVFVVTGILTPKEVLSGFSNESIASVILLILLTGGLRKNFNIEYFIDRLFRVGRRNSHLPMGYHSFMLRMMTQVAALSSIVNNTPIVAIMTPYVFNWGKSNNISPSKLLIPLSYATIMGGMVTIIGTSTTLVLNGFLSDYNLPTFHAQDLLIMGLAVSFTGITLLLILGKKLLPDRTDILENFRKNQREYLIETQLADNSPLIGASIIDAGLRNLRGMYLVEIIRDDEIISPVEPTEVLEERDVLIFAGNTDDVVELLNAESGLKLPHSARTHDGIPKVNVVEAVVSNNSSLVSMTAKESEFRTRFDAAIIAIHRNGERLSGKIGDIKLFQGDLLLLFAGPNFEERADLNRDVFIISKLKEIVKPSRNNVISFLSIALLAILMLVLGYFTLFTSLLIIFAIMVGLRMINLQDVKKESDLNLIAILVFSLALGQAMIKTGAGNLIAEWILNLTSEYGMIAIICSLLLLTTLLTSFVTNVGAVSIAFPLAYSMSNSLQIDGMPLYLAIAYSASAAFLTPIGYQTNLMVYGPGGYTFRDFFKIGIPITLVYLTTVLFCLMFLYKEAFL